MLDYVGEPKAIPWTHLTPLKAAADAWAHHDIRDGDVVAWPTNLGWMMGPWLIYAAFFNNASIALYNGSPLGSGFVKFVQVQYSWIKCVKYRGGRVNCRKCCLKVKLLHPFGRKL